MKAIDALAAGAAFVALARVSAAATLSIIPIDAQAVTSDGLNWTIDPASDSLNATRFNSSSLQRRGIMEFDLSGIPAGATINAVRFDYRINQFTSSSDGTTTTYPRIEFHGYAGNGVLEVADATRPFNLIGQSSLITQTTQHSTLFNASYVQERRTANTRLGVFTYQAVTGQASFYSTDAWYVDAAQRPLLTIDYTPAPTRTYYVTGYDQVIREYSTDGTPVGSRTVPHAGTPTPNSDGPVRGTAVGRDRTLHAYNGTFEAHVSSLHPTSGAWTHRTTAGLSTYGNVSFGNVAAFGSYVFASDAATAGDAPNGVVRFNTATNTAECFDSTGDSAGDTYDVYRGHDGLLYALFGSSQIRVYDPYSMNRLRTVWLPSGARGIAVSPAGEIYAAEWSGRVRKYAADGAVLATLSIPGNLSDLDLAADGTLLVGSWTGGVHRTTETLTSYTSLGGPTYSNFVTFAEPVTERGWVGLPGASTQWGDASNWHGPVPNGAGQIASFASPNSGTTHVTIDPDRSVGTLNFDVPNPYVLIGKATLRLDASTGRAFVNVAQGDHVLAAKAELADDLTIRLAPGGSFDVSTTNGRLDLRGHNVIVDHALGESPIAGMLADVRAAYAAGAWTGNGITSTLARDDAARLTGIGWADAVAIGLVDFDGVALDGSALLLKYTYYGDADLDGDVDEADRARLTLGGTTWAQGDFNYSGAVDADDLSLFDHAFARQGAPLRDGAAVPEPSTLGLMVAAATWAGTRRRRCR